MTYDALIQETIDNGIELIEIAFPKGLNGLFKGKKIGISKTLPTSTHKKCVLAEELGHYHTAVGNILDQTKIENWKIEIKGRQWGYKKLVPLEKIIKASFVGCANRYELAEYLDITEQYLDEVLKYYENKYGLYAEVGDYCIYFNPLTVAKYNYEEY